MATVLRLHAPVVLPCDADCTVLRDAVVDIDETGRIAHTGPRADAPALPEGAVLRECGGILMPGMVNTHAHTPMTLLRGLGAELPLLRWLREAIWPTEARLTPEDVHAGMVLGALEMLGAGVTTSVEGYFHADRMAEAVLQVGSRAVIGPAVLDLPGVNDGGWRRMTDDISAWIDADGLRFGPGERIELSYAPHSAYMLPPEALREIGEAARERGALVQTHVAEAAAEDLVQRERYGSVPSLLEELGVLGDRFLAAHCVHLSDDDIKIFARHGVGVAHCPGSNAKLASGTARLLDMVAAGVRVGLGTDGPASNDDLDLWEEARLAALFARLSASDASAVGAARVLLLATRGGAEALHRDDIGALEAGRWADVVHVDADDHAFPAGLGVPDDELLANLVWAAGARCVRDVWVAGEQVLAERTSTRVDLAEARATARVSALRIRTA
ncbi:Cytosine/adenosine deaminase [Streptoalloteichus tenebrarius]|uniref:Cytosine/adenosine deaminase n=2 Tax=Streptoalloteichus tenebrarius (strain ATCC 17920 / DSM 40477 / JCM 4838 / CBS 697.72 / NBRC 16177 / NCIMB 11028 / NRRL B-12390 / A12253. 1 / ISP 5477) TaxID=1933 RepID=A0ABT1I3M6_STRSD|nr:amidohydrolase [Streptoalloteichus tenebrarius]MCP2262354.1 Cytosine/adenosine deaminase [Streptoalloteichus tenebrarius]BFF02043.1 amidohydrolase [Streptoalloteichus tenebrarius]